MFQGDLQPLQALAQQAANPVIAPYAGGQLQRGDPFTMPAGSPKSCPQVILFVCDAFHPARAFGPVEPRVGLHGQAGVVSGMAQISLFRLLLQGAKLLCGEFVDGAQHGKTGLASRSALGLYQAGLHERFQDQGRRP